MFKLGRRGAMNRKWLVTEELLWVGLTVGAFRGEAEVPGQSITVRERQSSRPWKHRQQMDTVTCSDSELSGITLFRWEPSIYAANNHIISMNLIL